MLLYPNNDEALQKVSASPRIGSGMKPTDRNSVTETRHRDQNFYPGLQD